MRIYLKAFVLNLAKKSENRLSGLVPKHLRDIEREMEKGTMDFDTVMEALRKDEYLQPSLNAGDWKMIEGEVKKMIK